MNSLTVSLSCADVSPCFVLICFFHCDILFTLKATVITPIVGIAWIIIFLVFLDVEVFTVCISKTPPFVEIYTLFS